MTRLLTFLLTIFGASMIFGTTIQAKIRLPKIFSDDMILQREVSIPIWGWANPHEKISVSLSKQMVSTIADEEGKWLIKLKPETANVNLDLIVKGENTIDLKNVAIGEVWLCSGQSNMEWTVGQSINSEIELARSENSLIRHIKLPKTIAGLPEGDFKEGVWKVSNAENTKDFSGIGFFFAQKLYAELKVPIGLINTSWGGTNIETWISREGFESSDEFRQMIAEIPRMDLASLAASHRAKITAQVELLQGVTLRSFDSERFKDVSFDASKLPDMNIPEPWESQSLVGFDGVVWLRKTVELTDQQVAKDALLELAKIDDNDETFVNGIKVGEINQWDAPRKYQIPRGLLHLGRNIIAVRITDNGGGGGIYGNADDVKLTLADEKISLAGSWKFQVEKIKSELNENDLPSLAYNAVINPLIPYAFRGVLWYQGESNAGRAYQYRTAFPLLINDWRSKWQKQFPFYFVQLATFRTAGNSNSGSSWAELREAQTMTLSLPKTAMAVTTDIGNPKEIHPLNKQEVGRRLAAIALNRTYKTPMIDGGPSFRSLKIVGDKAVVSFRNVGGGLIANSKNGAIPCFEIAGIDRVFHTATASIEANKIIVQSEKNASPVAVRFAWIGDASACNLFNKEGFPAVPFRTDTWKTVTENEKYKTF